LRDSFVSSSGKIYLMRVKNKMTKVRTTMGILAYKLRTLNGNKKLGLCADYKI
jgi:hypothetical protein